ncbi:MAG: tetratricopeptide repeat protein [Acidobacteriota bacterium]|nr:tetratricopeptide repeat protein [Acidobacteriota bacterium]
MAVQRDKVIANAEKLVAKGKIEPAIKEYERLLEDSPNDVNTLNRIGDLWVRVNNNGEAVKVFSKIADHYSKDGFFLKAIAIFKKINKLDPSKLEIYAKLADLYAKQGLAMEAKSQYQVLADYYLKHGEPASALAIYRKISELDPQSINVHVKLADLYSQNNQTAEALKEYDRVGRLLLKRGMLDEAVQVFRKALKIEPKNTDLVDSLVTALLEAKDFDNARQIVDAALEANANNPRLLGMLGRIQLGRGDNAGARATLERAVAADPNDPLTRETMADLYLKQNDADRALEMIAPLVERALGKGERATAIEMLNRILRVESGHTPTLERLVAVYSRLNEETNILASMSSLAEAHVSRMHFDEASKVLEKLIQREPQNAQHRNKLQFVRSQMGGLDTVPARGGRSASPIDLPPMEIDEPAPAFDGYEEPDTEFSLEIDSSPALDLGLPHVDAGRSAASGSPPTHLISAVEMVAADLAEGGDDLDFITEHLTEAEVFSKYGLAEKAAEHLRAVLERAPANLTANDRLFRILLEEGEVDAARTAAHAYVAILEDKGDGATAAAVKNEFVSRGERFEPPPSAEPMPSFASESSISIDDFAGADDEMSFDLDAPTEMEFDLEPPAVAAPEPEPMALPADDPVSPEPEIQFEDQFDARSLGTIEELPVAEEIESDMFEELQVADEVVPESTFEEPEELTLGEVDEDALAGALEPAPDDLFGSMVEPAGIFDEAELAEALPAILDEPLLMPEPQPEEPFFGVEALGELLETDELPLEEIGEVDFYIEQELFDEARRKLDALQARFPGNFDLQSRSERIAIAVAAAAAAAAAPRPPVFSRDEIESELLSAIPDDDDDFSVPPPAAATPVATPPPPVISAALVQEENLFADEDNFFDLAAELESELADEEEAISLSEEEQSLEEIFREFKKGVEQQLDSEDYDTHYNLGIAYKEMGLIDEAIGEFQLASKDPKRAVECASMLGLCFLEKGMPQLAIKWYRKGIEMPEVTEDEHVGLLYDLASAYQEVGDTDNAQKAFMEVYGMNSNYRDIVSRIKQLEDAKR